MIVHYQVYLFLFCCDFSNGLSSFLLKKNIFHNQYTRGFFLHELILQDAFYYKTFFTWVTLLTILWTVFKCTLNAYFCSKLFLQESQSWSLIFSSIFQSLLASKFVVTGFTLVILYFLFHELISHVGLKSNSYQNICNRSHNCVLWSVHELVFFSWKRCTHLLLLLLQMLQSWPSILVEKPNYWILREINSGFDDVHTVWKCQKFSVTVILREINFGYVIFLNHVESEVNASTHLLHLCRYFIFFSASQILREIVIFHLRALIKIKLIFGL